jgi:hypothetical protein
MAVLFLIFNHQITSDQEADARRTLGVKAIVSLPEALQNLWSNIPPDLPKLMDYLRPLRDWLSAQAGAGDHVLIQGDFGACYLMVGFALKQGLIPIYSTTQREAEEERQPDGTVKLTHHFQHNIFRRYGV